MKWAARVIVLTLVSAGAWPGATWAFNFVPTRAQWDSWPPHCKARYSISNAGDGTEFARAVPAPTVEQWRSQVGDYVWSHMHHYCAGIAWQFSARLETDPKRRAEILRRAQTEVDYTYRHLQPGMPLYTTVSIAMGSIWYDRGVSSRALEYLSGAIASQPSEPSPYVAAASIYSREKQYDRARQILLAGDQATDGQSADIQYQLGLVSLELGDRDSAEAYAKKAYDMGHPLPGLRRKLEATAGNRPK